MSTLVDNSNEALARRIQIERKSRKWSMADLADRSGVSRAAISKIERGEMSPTANVLVRLAYAFDLTFAGLLIRAEQSGEPVQRAADQSLWEDPGTGYVRRQLYRSAEVPVELAKIYLPAGTKVPLPQASFEFTREVIHVVDGTLTIYDAAGENTLYPGDSYAALRTKEVVFHNQTNEPCTYLVALSRS
ncbi:MAG: helix-turn-helix domain-containing protein [Pseudomonadota bacterium]